MIGKDVAKAASLLSDGLLVGIPTETVYGLAANALDAKAVAEIYRVKNRPQFNPLIIHCASIEEAKKYVKNWSSTVNLLATTFWPGSISFLLPKTDLVPDLITAGSHKVVVRVPNHPLTLDLLSQLDFPLAAPSANISNTVSPTNADHVENTIGSQLSYVLDGGSCSIGVESTIVGFEDEKVVIHREGGVTREAIKALGLEIVINKAKAIHTPGQLKRHYATSTPLLVVDSIEQWIEENPNTRAIALLYAKRDLGIKTIILSKNYSLSEIANNLFGAMRIADTTDAEAIVVEPIINEGIGRAIADRLARAAAQ